MPRRYIAGLILLVGLASGRVVAQDDLAFYSDRINAVTQQVVADIRPTLDARAQHILDDIEFRAPQTWVTNAEARRGFGNHRVVEYNAGFLAVADWLALAMIADWGGHGGCMNEYSDYLAELVSHNSRRAWNGKERKHVHDFESYAANTHGRCEGALTSGADSARRKELREEMLNAIAATVLLHEIGHHVLDHLSGPSSNFMQRRMHEVEADRWAINTAVHANYELRTSVPLFLFLAATGGGTLEDEIRSSHPSGLKRVRDMLVQTRNLLDDSDPVNAHLLDASIDDLNRTLR